MDIVILVYLLLLQIRNCPAIHNAPGEILLGISDPVNKRSFSQQNNEVKPPKKSKYLYLIFTCRWGTTHSRIDDLFICSQILF